MVFHLVGAKPLSEYAWIVFTEPMEMNFSDLSLITINRISYILGKGVSCKMKAIRFVSASMCYMC